MTPLSLNAVLDILSFDLMGNKVPGVGEAS